MLTTAHAPRTFVRQTNRLATDHGCIAREFQRVRTTCATVVTFLKIRIYPLYIVVMHWSDGNDPQSTRWVQQTVFVMTMFSYRVPLSSFRTFSNPYIVVMHWVRLQ
jgi:hypothetical protein